MTTAAPTLNGAVPDPQVPDPQVPPLDPRVPGAGVLGAQPDPRRLSAQPPAAENSETGACASASGPSLGRAACRPSPASPRCVRATLCIRRLLTAHFQELRAFAPRRRRLVGLSLDSPGVPYDELYHSPGVLATPGICRSPVCTHACLHLRMPASSLQIASVHACMLIPAHACHVSFGMSLHPPMPSHVARDTGACMHTRIDA